jgi:hypothetical protein
MEEDDENYLDALNSLIDRISAIEDTSEIVTLEEIQKE